MASSPFLYLFTVLTYIAFFVFVAVTSPPQLESCHSYKFPNNAKFSACNDLPVFDCSSIHWNYNFSSNSIDMAFKKDNVKHNRWIAWGINPTSTGMVGSQAFVAFKKSDGTMAAYTSPITTYGTRLEKGNLSFHVHAVSASFEYGTMIIYAKFQLPGNYSTVVNHVWQQGFVFQDTLQLHPTSEESLKSFGQLDFLKASYYPVKDHRKILLRKVSGILNGIAWGILMPIGVMMARYLKAFEATYKSAWFHLHWVCQIVAYVIGIAGSGVAIHIGTNEFLDEPWGFFLVSLCTIQILAALFLRPKEEEEEAGHNNEKRFRWNLHHYLLGYLAMFMAMCGGGFLISKRVYIGFVVSLACVAAILEFRFYWIHMKRQNILQSNSAQVHPVIGPHGNNQIPN